MEHKVFSIPWRTLEENDQQTILFSSMSRFIPASKQIQSGVQSDLQENSDVSELT